MPLINDAHGSKQHKEIAENFLTVQKLLEMYEDPLKHFKNDTRTTDQVELDLLWLNQVFNALFFQRITATKPSIN